MQGVMPSSHWAIEHPLPWALCLLLLLLSGAMHRGLWWGEDNLIYKIQVLEADVLRQQQESLVVEVLNLKEGLEAIEERARNELGMIREGEIFYRVIEPAIPTIIPTPLTESAPKPVPEDTHP